ncbi:hypothetical protein OQA88_5434 [Cercophora sp. LCS_1]
MEQPISQEQAFQTNPFSQFGQPQGRTDVNQQHPPQDLTAQQLISQVYDQYRPHLEQAFQKNPFQTNPFQKNPFQKNPFQTNLHSPFEHPLGRSDDDGDEWQRKLYEGMNQKAKKFQRGKLGGSLWGVLQQAIKKPDKGITLHLDSTTGPPPPEPNPIPMYGRIDYSQALYNQVDWVGKGKGLQGVSPSRQIHHFRVPDKPLGLSSQLLGALCGEYKPPGPPKLDPATVRWVPKHSDKPTSIGSPKKQEEVHHLIPSDAPTRSQRKDLSNKLRAALGMAGSDLDKRRTRVLQSKPFVKRPPPINGLTVDRGTWQRGIGIWQSGKRKAPAPTDNSYVAARAGAPKWVLDY